MSEEETVESLRERIETLRGELEAAETESELDDVEAAIETLRADLEEADLPEPDEDEADPAAELDDEIDDLEADLEEARGPYAEDVVDEIEGARSEIADERWTERGREELRESVLAALDDVNAALGTSLTLADDEALIDRLVATLETVEAEIEAADLDPDDDAGTIESLLETAEDLAADVDDAQAWDDLSVREQLDAQGYYDVLDHVKDYPPEWHALKVHSKRGDVEMVLLALETFDSDFMEEHAFEALARMAPEEAIEPMLERAGKRSKPAIEILGKIGVADEEVVDTLLEYVDADGDPLLQKATFKALGEIGTERAVGPIADQLVAENAEVRSHAARALGLVGDTRAIDPLADVLAEDEDDTVRASAAWALNRIGTEEALEVVAEYDDDRAYVVQNEGERAAEAVREPART